MLHLKVFEKNDIHVVPFKAEELLNSSIEEYFENIRAEYHTQSMQQPIIIIFPILDEGKWMRFELSNIYITNNHATRDYLQELCTLLNAPTGLDILIKSIKNLFHNGSLKLNELKLEYRNINDIPLVQYN